MTTLWSIFILVLVTCTCLVHLDQSHINNDRSSDGPGELSDVSIKVKVIPKSKVSENKDRMNIGKQEMAFIQEQTLIKNGEDDDTDSIPNRYRIEMNAENDDVITNSIPNRYTIEMNADNDDVITSSDGIDVGDRDQNTAATDGRGDSYVRRISKFIGSYFTDESNLRDGENSPDGINLQADAVPHPWDEIKSETKNEMSSKRPRHKRGFWSSDDDDDDDDGTTTPTAQTTTTTIISTSGSWETSSPDMTSVKLAENSPSTVVTPTDKSTKTFTTVTTDMQGISTTAGDDGEGGKLTTTEKDKGTGVIRVSPANLDGDVTTKPDGLQGDNLAKLKQLYIRCNSCMVETRREECMTYKPTVEILTSFFSRLHSLIVYGCPRKDKDDHLCCHDNNQYIDSFLKELSAKLQDWETILRAQCQKCPVDCKWTEWSAWSECPFECEVKTRRTRTRTQIGPHHGGRSCHPGYTSEYKECPIHPPKQEHWSLWGQWSSCSSSCGGVKTRKRTCSQSGHPCSVPCTGQNTEVKECGSTDDCCVLATWSSWTEWSKCPQTGKYDSKVNKFRHRTCDPQETGKPICPGQCHGKCTETKDCCEPAKWTQWTTWTECSNAGGSRLKVKTGPHVAKDLIDDDNHACLYGCMNRTRICIRGTCEHGCDGVDKEYVNCYLGACCVRADWTEWSAWSSCESFSCQTRDRSCVANYVTTPLNSTHPQPVCRKVGCQAKAPQIQKQDCPQRKCEKPYWSTWGAWGECLFTDSVTTHGVQRRYRQGCYNPSAHLNHCTLNGCGTDRGDEKQCVRECVAGQWSCWSGWSTCSVSCGQGRQKRTRVCDDPNQCGQQCQGDGLQERVCNEGPCCVPGNGQWSSWSGWSTCSVTCGLGRQKRTRQCDDHGPNHCGQQCQGDGLQERVCNEGPCCVPQHGGWTSWSPWTVCSVTCGTGIQSRSRMCSRPAPNRCGNQCQGRPTQVKRCDHVDCCIPLDGGWSSWSQWGPCSVTCGKGTKRRDRQCNRPIPNQCGRNCPGTSFEEMSCGTKPNPGTWSQWTEWSKCDCSSHIRYRSRARINTNGCDKTPEQQTEKMTCRCCEENCYGRDNGFYPSRCEKGCKHYIICCKGVMTKGVQQCSRRGEIYYPACKNCIYVGDDNPYSCPTASLENIPCPFNLSTRLDINQFCKTQTCTENCLGRSDGFYASRCIKDCKHYIRCCNGYPAIIDMTCAGNSFYNAERGCCTKDKPETCQIGIGDSYTKVHDITQQYGCVTFK